MCVLASIIRVDNDHNCEQTDIHIFAEEGEGADSGERASLQAKGEVGRPKRRWTGDPAFPHQRLMG